MVILYFMSFTTKFLHWNYEILLAFLNATFGFLALSPGAR